MRNNSYFPYAFFEDKIVRIEEAKVNIMTNALQYGSGVFGGIRGYLSVDKNKINIFRIRDHYRRFLKSLNILNKSIKYDESKLVEITLELVKVNRPKSDCYIRPFAYGANFNISPDLSNLDFKLAIYMIYLGEYLSISKGLNLIFSNWIRINDNMIPSRAKITGGYINSSLAKAEATKLGFDDALMLSFDGHVAEASAANFFMVKDGVLITPSKNSDILEGITRKTIIHLAKDLKIPTEEREIDRTEVYAADEAFLSGTGVQLAWIDQVDGRRIGEGKIGPVTKRLQQLFFNIVRGKEKKYSFWLTQI